MFDSHIHTAMSFDSEMEASKALESLKKNGMSGVFTEHYDFGYPEAESFEFNPVSYFKQYSTIHSESILLGIEVGMVEGYSVDAARLTQGHPFDYVIGSIHVVENVDIYYPEFYQGRSKLETYLAYFRAMETCIQEYTDIDALGHIDYIARYGPYENPEIWVEEDLKIAIDRVLRLVIEKDWALEFNTRRIQDEKDFQVVLPIYQRFLELGGRYVTIGSDAHTPDAIGWKCAEAAERLRDLGLVPVVFKKRKRIVL